MSRPQKLTIFAVDPGDKPACCSLDLTGRLVVWPVRPVGGTVKRRRLRLGHMLRHAPWGGATFDLLAIEYAALRGAKHAFTNGWLGMSAGIWHAVSARHAAYLGPQWKRNNAIKATIAVLTRNHGITEWPTEHCRDAFGVLLAAQRELEPGQRVEITSIHVAEELR